MDNFAHNCVYFLQMCIRDSFYNALTEYLDKEETQVLAIMGNHENYDLRWETGVDSLSGEQRNEANAYIAENSRKLFEEFYGEFVEYDTGETYDYLNLHVKINGYHFIGISSDWENRWAYDYNSDTCLLYTSRCV